MTYSQAWVLEELTVTGPWGTAVANATSLRGGYAPAYNTLSLVLYDSPVSHIYLKNQAVRVFIRADGGVANCLFAGRVRAARSIVGGPDEYAVYVECDGDECTADRDFINSPRAAEALGWICYFNEGGRPNKHPVNDEFYYGPTAAFWTGASAIKKIRTKYMTRASWTLTDATIDAVAMLTQEIRPYDARGQRPLDAICHILSECACRMAFRYATGAAVPVLFDHTGAGTFEVYWAPVTAPAGAIPATADLNAEIYELSCGYDLRKNTPVMVAQSAPAVIETTYSTQGATALITGAASVDPKYAWEYRINVVNYQPNWLGASLTAGEKPHPCLSKLATRRRTGLAGQYHTASEVTADPEIGEEIDAKETLQIYDTTEAKWYTVVQGMSIDYDSLDGVLVRLQKKVTVQSDTAGNQKQKNVHLSMPALRITLATVVRSPLVYQLGTYAATPAAVPPVDVDGLLNCDNLTPSWRFNSTLPGSTPNSSTVVAATVEAYRNVTPLLTAMLTNRYAQRGMDSNMMEFMLPFWPAEIPLGAKVVVTPAVANSGITGNELITEFDWDLGDVEVRVRATDSYDLAQDWSGTDVRDIMKRLKKLERSKK